ncbi:choice-of-anchor A family protein [Streptomyces sulphureus]|uniref:choice-of-anchor A family protein n=1 Tax=Streptomyces sulphureus TaxID=47758 RepID=UPI00036408E3|nr:choice-of-anchor A family protein [Streptomyces sulphureus]
MEASRARRNQRVRCRIRTAAIAAASLALLPFPAAADPLPGGLGPCLGDDCPAAWRDSAGVPVAHHDTNVNVFVGGDFDVRQAAAESEGRNVVLGDFDLHKRAGVPKVYNIGAPGGGSRVPPPDGSDHLLVGGDLTVAQGQRLLAGEGGSAGMPSYGGTSSGTVPPRAVRTPGPAPQYAHLRAQLTAASHCYAYEGDQRRAPTGTWRTTGSETVLTGDGNADLQVFSVDADLATPAGNGTSLRFASVPEDATVLVNLYGKGRRIRSLLTAAGPGLRERLLWNFPDAAAVGLHGTAPFQGSILVGNPRSRTTLDLPDTNGRLYTAGSLTHTSSGSSVGQTIHASPFLGDLPACTDASGSPSPAQYAPTSGPGEGGSAHSPWPGPTPSGSERATPLATDAGRPAGGTGPALSDTGAGRGEWLTGATAAALLAAGVTVALLARRSRRHE